MIESSGERTRGSVVSSMVERVNAEIQTILGHLKYFVFNKLGWFFILFLIKYPVLHQRLEFKV